ncbi:uncharacterized protein EMH_0004910 [Eimeria mitis]|uniref:Uncharacterized protein n=1 Tax=Eimeria mitis TaxID=44415 RepID=U6KCA6_9EIME|nr:uncharacterized protein EMH_0004910 [Eimeria mitis]CDJ35589.1 hypothetical protein, conserved [Eimeria mitis]
MPSSPLDRPVLGPSSVPQGSYESAEATGRAPKAPHGSGGGPLAAPAAPKEQGEAISAARKNPHYGEDVDDKIVGTGCSDEYAKLQDCLDETDKRTALRVGDTCDPAGGRTFSALQSIAYGGRKGGEITREKAGCASRRCREAGKRPP